MACCFVCVVVVLLCIACGGVTSCSCNTSTVWDALAALHRSTNGATWLRSGMWLQPGSSVCDWHGVVACRTLELGSNNLTGTLPAELSLLAATSFVVLNFSHNGISGTIPPQLSLLALLLSCNMCHNNLHGTLPRELATWSQLTDFYVCHNNIFGTLPPEYSNWTTVYHLDFAGNNISGSLPPQYAAWTPLTWFAIASNRVTGTLPPEYAAWTALWWFTIDNNLITGTLPREYAAWSLVGVFAVDINRLHGTLPPEYAAWSALGRFLVADNQLAGSLPLEYGAWRGITVAHFSDNNLTGTLPSSYSNWTAISVFDLSRNNFSTTLPPEYAVWSALESFRIQNNQVSGTLPPEYSAWSALTFFRIDVDSNQLTGTLPPEYAAWNAATELILSRNRLSGTIPAAYGALRPEVLLLNDNMLSGTVPTLRVSNILTLHNNRQLRGTLPSDMGLTLLVVLCNTSTCGAYPPMWASGLTRVVCAHADASTSIETLVTGLFFAPKYVLPLCSTPQPQTPSPSQLGDMRSKVTMIASSVGGLSAALTGSTAMHVSLRAAFYAGRVAKCSDDASSAIGTEGSEFGVLIVDNPTRLTIPGPFPLTSGTVIGNLLMLVAVPLLCASPYILAPRLMRRAGAVAVVGHEVSWPATSLLLVWGFVQVPTAAASVSLMIETVRAASTTGGVVCAVGCTLCGGATALAVTCWLRVRRCGGRCMSVAHRKLRTFSAVRGCLFRSRSVWAAKTCLRAAGSAAVKKESRPSNTTAAAVVRWVSPVLHAVSLLLLRGCHYPHSWVIVYDAVCALLSGALIGVAATPHVSCRAVQAAAWAIVGVACVQAAVAVVVRPRSTVADCAFDAVMCTWTVVGALLAALGVEEASENSAIAQGAVALLYGLPAVVLRCHRTWCAANAKHERGETEKRCLPMENRRLMNSGRLVKNLEQNSRLTICYVSPQEALRVLVSHACCPAVAWKDPLPLSSAFRVLENSDGVLRRR